MLKYSLNSIVGLGRRACVASKRLNSSGLKESYDLIKAEVIVIPKFGSTIVIKNTALSGSRESRYHYFKSTESLERSL